MIKVDQLRRWQEQRLVPVLESWNDAKEHLEKAIALAETREREFREVSEDVHRKLGALEVVIGMANEMGDELPSERLLNAVEKTPTLMLPEKASVSTETPETSIQVQPAAPHTNILGGLLRRSSRPLFPAHQRSKPAGLSILQ